MSMVDITVREIAKAIGNSDIASHQDKEEFLRKFKELEDKSTGKSYNGDSEIKDKEDFERLEEVLEELDLSEQAQGEIFAEVFKSERMDTDEVIDFLMQVDKYSSDESDITKQEERESLIWAMTYFLGVDSSDVKSVIGNRDFSDLSSSKFEGLLTKLSKNADDTDQFIEVLEDDVSEIEEDDKEKISEKDAVSEAKRGARQGYDDVLSALGISATTGSSNEDLANVTVGQILGLSDEQRATLRQYISYEMADTDNDDLSNGYFILTRLFDAIAGAGGVLPEGADYTESTTLGELFTTGAMSRLSSDLEKKKSEIYQDMIDSAMEAHDAQASAMNSAVDGFSDVGKSVSDGATDALNNSQDMAKGVKKMGQTSGDSG